jgi:hypothetical protein
VAATGLGAGDADGSAIQRVSVLSSVKDTDVMKGIVDVNILASIPTSPPLASKEMAAWPEGHPSRARLALDLEPDTEFERVLTDDACYDISSDLVVTGRVVDGDRDRPFSQNVV